MTLNKLCFGQKISVTTLKQKIIQTNGEIIVHKTEAVTIISEFLKIEDSPKKSDVIFILGGSSISPVYKAHELYQDGYAPIIAFTSTGGVFGGEEVFGMPENEKYKEVLLGLGIPENAMISEGTTTNTLVEARRAIVFIRENGIEPNKVILVSRPIHQRRAFSTFVKQHPDVKYINCPASESLNEDDVKRLPGEIERLIKYAAKGDIIENEIPKNVLKACEVLR